MGPDHFRDKWIKVANHLPSRVIIMRKRGVYQSACMRIIHVMTASTSPVMTAGFLIWLQICGRKIDNPL